MIQYKIKICWGSEFTRLDSNNESITYSFNSEAERNAFLDGVEAACGWVDYCIIEEEMIRNLLPSIEDPSNPKYSC
jgi:hypothetical protein